MQVNSSHASPSLGGRRHHATHSKSMPSTPFQGPDTTPGPRASPSPEPLTTSGSPRSLPSDNQTPPAGRRKFGGCKYETGMQRARRRVPYSLGAEPLDRVKSDLKTCLTSEEDERLTQDVQKLYEELQPTDESEERRTRFIAKLESILRERWPTASIAVKVFGSTGNKLGTSDSDVDICITTDSRELERVCNIAELLANHGMERVVCVSSAKVPIVKIWDPELQVACDINVNNPLALENTTLVKTYVDIDSRVRPLAMIIKYWAKRRILNDAALGGTLSSYTWICLALNFLQTRDPPILPTLQDQPNLSSREVAGVNAAFDINENGAYNNFGSRNKSTLGQLLFQFFRYYGHELDFEQNVVSVRLGRCLTKVEKAWHLLQDNRLCVEEPFNVSRNLANTADDTSMRGIHLELRRAFDLIGDGKLLKCCEQFVHSPEETKPSDIFVPPPNRSVTTQLPIQAPRPGRNAARGGRNATSLNRSTNGRRSSNPAARNMTYVRNVPYQMMTQEQQLQQQHQQHILHNQLYQQYHYLQLQERELRMQLYQQNLQQQRGLMSAYGEGFSYSLHDDGSDPPSSNGRAPLSAPLYQNAFPRSPYLTSGQLSQGVSTNPPSPRLNSGLMDGRRYSRRTSLTQSAMGGSLRAQSQPARGVPVNPLAHLHRPDIISVQESVAGRRSSASSTSLAEGYSASVENGYSTTNSLYDPVRRPGEYLGYYVGQSPSFSAVSHSTAISPIPSHAGLAIQNGGLSPRLVSVATRPPGAMHTPPQERVFPAARGAIISEAAPDSVSRKLADGESVNDSSKPRAGPLIVDGAVKSPRRRRTTLSLNDPEDSVNFSASTSEDLAFDTPSSSDEHSQDAFESPGHARDSPPRINEAKEHTLLNGIYGNAIGLSPVRVASDDIADGVEGSPSAGLTTAKKPSNTAWPFDRQLSSVEEIRTPSPRAETFHSPGSSPAGTIEPRGLTNGHGLGKMLSPVPNGTPSISDLSVATPSGGHGWQTQKKKKSKRKTVQSENDVQTTNAFGGETLPADESLRKGG